MQIREALNEYQNALLSIYDNNESRSISELVFMHVFNFSKAALFANDNSVINDERKQLLDKYLKRLLTGEPVQYVLGETEFYGLRLFVNKHVLIPRPETEELVEWIIKEVRSRKSEVGSRKLLDIGTGSGCIPISIKKNIPELDVYALDISADALKVAKQNAELNKVEINFIKTDILKQQTSVTLSEDEVTKQQTFNLIVSNPPYVRKSEMKQMHNNVLNYEPHLALFVEDDDALLFYKHIADFALQHLAPGGKLYFEVNEAMGNDVIEMLNQKGFQNIILKKDMYGKDRMIRCEL
ncbi:MAG: peptide chain release factor N(5)-glutamine methyltransferase [Bacteroidia bacterium]